MTMSATSYVTCLKSSCETNMHVYPNIHRNLVLICEVYIIELRIKNGSESDLHTLAVTKKAQKKGSNRIGTHDLCNTGAMLYWLSYETSMGAGQLRVPNIFPTLALSKAGHLLLFETKSKLSDSSLFVNSCHNNFKAHFGGSLGGALTVIKSTPLCNCEKPPQKTTLVRRIN